MESQTQLLPPVPISEKPKDNLSGPERVTFVKPAPNLLDLAMDSKPRDNQITSTNINEYGMPETKTFTEKNGFIKMVRHVNNLMLSDDPQIETTCQQFRENLFYVGENELQEATDGIASHLLEYAKDEQEVFMFSPNNRSEQYISLRIAESIDKQTEQDENLKQKIHLFDMGEWNAFVEKIKETKGKIKIIIADDFAINGIRIVNFTEEVASRLQAAGYSDDETTNMIEAVLVADKSQDVYSKNRHRFSSGKPIKTFAYYKFPPEGHISSSHSSVDFGFEEVIEKLRALYKSRHGIESVNPFLTNIERPYEMKDGVYTDPQLQQRWIDIKAKFGTTRQK